MPLEKVASFVNAAPGPQVIVKYVGSTLTFDKYSNVTLDSFSQDINANTLTYRLTLSGFPTLTASNLFIQGCAALSSLSGYVLVDGNTIDVVFSYWNNGVDSGYNGETTIAIWFVG